MATAYRWAGSDARDFPTLGYHVEPNDIVYFDGRPPDPLFVEATTEQATATEVPAGAADWRTAALGDDEPRQPNKAAPADDWKAYAAAHGGFQEATGTHPDDATRKAIVDHYTAEQGADEQPGAVSTDDASKGV